MSETIKTKPRIAVIGLSGKSVFMRVKNFPAMGETVTAEEIFTEYGGKGFNQAVTIAKLGGEANFLTAVGEDGDGERCLQRLKEEGVKAFPAKKNVPTAFATILTDRKGENAVTVYRGASDALTESDVESFAKTISECDLLLLQAEIPTGAIDAAIDAAKKVGVPVLYNPAPADRVTKEQIYKVDYLLPNRFEREHIVGAEEAKNLIVTLGADGAEARFGNRKTRVKAITVEAVDTTGAGDAFCGAFAYFLAAVDKEETALKKAVVAGGITATKKGASCALRLEEVRAVYQVSEESLWKN